jgi:hypothetical protein
MSSPIRYLAVSLLLNLQVASCAQPPVFDKSKLCSSNSASCSSKDGGVKEPLPEKSDNVEPAVNPGTKPDEGPAQEVILPAPDTKSPTPDPMTTPTTPDKIKDPVVIPPEAPSAQCTKGENFTFSNYPAKWDIEKTGRIKDAMVNETIFQDPIKGAVLQVKYGKGTTSPSASRTRGLIPGGTQFIPKLTRTYDHAVMSYWLKIPKDFDCVKGGKLPGIASNIELLSGGETADGTNGFSMRLMWRENCTAEVYGYLPRVENQHLIEKYKDSLTQNPTTKIIYGWSIGRGEFSLPKGEWVKVDLTIKVNDPGMKNGTVKVAFNGKQVFQRDEIVYRTNDKLLVGALFFSTFFGGSDESYAATKDEHLYFGDMTVCPL